MSKLIAYLFDKKQPHACRFLEPATVLSGEVGVEYPRQVALGNADAFVGSQAQLDSPGVAVKKGALFLQCIPNRIGQRLRYKREPFLVRGHR